ncbi:hypothetical protein FRC09_007620 [Ceratobasidium sp. 395]|nr:hypothetical protein FRC09_007620 [Ceratobasidium sp. 395]
MRGQEICGGGVCRWCLATGDRRTSISCGVIDQWFDDATQLAEAEAEDEDKGRCRDAHGAPSQVGVDYWGKAGPRLAEEHMLDWLVPVNHGQQARSGFQIRQGSATTHRGTRAARGAHKPVPASKVEKPGQQARVGKPNQARQITAKQGGI